MPHQPKSSVLATSALKAALAAGLFAGLATGALAQQSTITINDSRVFPESLTSTADGTVYIGSTATGNVYRATPGASTADTWIKKEQGGLGSILGVFADERSGTLYVCSSDMGPPASTTLKAFDLKSGAAKGAYPFPGAGRCNDIATTADGTAYATDTPGGRILRLKPGASALEVWLADPQLAGIDGLAFAGGQLYINNVQKNLLQRVEMKPDGTAGAVTTITTSQPLSGPDGMRTGKDGKTLLIAENRVGRVVQVALDGDKGTVQLIKDGYTQTPTAITQVGNTLWVLEAKFGLRNDTTKNPDPFVVTSVPLPVGM